MGYIDKDYRVITHEQWLKLIKDDEYQKVSRTRCSNGILIDTFWSGQADIYGPDGAQIFATHITFNNDNPTRKYTYATEEQAILHHDALVEIWDDDRETVDRFTQLALELDEEQ